jgi:hypothetical protein
MQNKIISKVLTGFFMLVLLAVPQISYADFSIGIGIGGGDRHDDRGYHHDDHAFYRYHDHPHYGLHMHFLPEGYLTIWVGMHRYYYYDGLYYTYIGGDYVIVNPPIGAHVTVIPPDFQPVLINGVTYYTDNGIYYILTKHHGYKVVVHPTPFVVTQPAVTVVAAPVSVQDSFPVNIPNNNGGYVTVVIKKSGNGFVGPQGEFYAQFPSVAQLKVMYTK